MIFAYVSALLKVFTLGKVFIILFSHVGCLEGKSWGGRGWHARGCEDWLNGH